MYISPSHFRHTVVFSKLERNVVDDEGLPIIKYTELFTARAKVMTLVGKEYTHEQTTDNRESIRIWVRYNKNFPTHADRFTLDGKVWNVVYANDVDHERRYIEVRGEIMNESND